MERSPQVSVVVQRKRLQPLHRVLPACGEQHQPVRMRRRNCRRVSQKLRHAIERKQHEFSEETTSEGNC